MAQLFRCLKSIFSFILNYLKNVGVKNDNNILYWNLILEIAARTVNVMRFLFMNKVIALPVPGGLRAFFWQTIHLMFPWKQCDYMHCYLPANKLKADKYHPHSIQNICEVRAFKWTWHNGDFSMVISFFLESQFTFKWKLILLPTASFRFVLFRLVCGLFLACNMWCWNVGVTLSTILLIDAYILYAVLILQRQTCQQ